MTDLTPAAQAVLDASMEHSGPAFEPVVRKLVAAAIRAAAGHGEVLFDVHEIQIWAVTVEDLLAIASELEES